MATQAESFPPDRMRLIGQPVAPHNNSLVHPPNPQPLWKSIARGVGSVPTYFWMALLLRLLLMALSGHNDALFIPWISNAILVGHLDLYDFLASVREMEHGDLARLIWASNPPLTYLTIAGWLGIAKWIGVIDVLNWNYAGYQAWNLSFPVRMLFFSKGLYLFADLGAWLVLRGLVPSNRRKLLDLIWLFSPITLIGIYVMGQTDILSVFWVVVGLAFGKRSFESIERKPFYEALALFCLGVAAANKFWPLMLVPVFATIFRKQFLPWLLLVLCAVLPLLVITLPYMPSLTFRDWVLFGFSDEFIVSNPGDWIQKPYPFLMIWGGWILYLIVLKSSFDLLWKSSFLVMLAFFTLNSFWEFYWLTWVLPFLALAVSFFPIGIWFYLFQNIHFLLYTIAGWNLWIGVFNIAFRSVPFGRGNLRSLIYKPGQHNLLNLFLTISFSLFIVASWALFAIVWFNDRLPAEIRQQNESKVSTWLAWIAPGLLGLYIIAVFDVASEPFGRIPVFSLLRHTLATMQLDRAFLVFFATLILVVLVFGLVSLVFGHRRQVDSTSQV